MPAILYQILFSIMILSGAHADTFEEPDTEVTPLWELGIGGGGTYAPDYPGSDQSQLWGIPFPYGIYRGDILHSDRRGGTRARLFRSASYEFNFSGGGGLPSSSANNNARKGLPDLEWLGELGPRLTIDLASYPAKSLLRLGLPLRAAFSTNGQHLTDRGFLLAPELLYDLPRAFGWRADMYALLTMNFSDRRFADYFYSVKPEYATAYRPAFRARAGYFESDLTVGWALPLKTTGLKIITAASVQSLQGAANHDSPLMRTSWNSSLSLILVWIFARSEVKVTSED